MDYRKNPTGVLDKLKSSGANISGSTSKLKGLVSGACNKRKLEFKKKKPESPFKEIEFGKELKEIPKCYLLLVLSFVSYIAATSTCNFRIEGRNLSTGELTTKFKPYIHRWTEVYRKSIIAKLYQLEQAIGEEQNNVTMITLTVYQRGMDPITCLLNLMRAYRCLMDVMRKKYGKIDYFWMLEPHKTGYAHMHLLYWRILSECEQEHIRKLWERKYRAGKEGIGIKFSLPEASEDGTFKAGSIAKVRSYLIKYLSKGLYKKWSPAELLFNAVLWKTKTRMWGCSRNFSKIMKPDIQEREDWECSEVWLCNTDEDEEPDLVWSKERKESGLLGSDKNSKSLVDCEKETSHHSVYTKPRSVSVKEYDNWLLNEVFKQERAELLGMSVPFWKRHRRVSIEETRQKLARLLNST